MKQYLNKYIVNGGFTSHKNQFRKILSVFHLFSFSYDMGMFANLFYFSYGCSMIFFFL